MTIKEHPDLNKERVELFLAALESGEYTQCTGRLREQVVPVETMIEEQRHCALGVATEVALNNGLREELKDKFPPNMIPGIMENALFRGGDLNGYVAAWYGFTWNDPLLEGDGGDEGSFTVAGLNDAGMSFWDLAQMGRKRWLKDQDA